jgi:hypothetical protein
MDQSVATSIAASCATVIMHSAQSTPTASRASHVSWGPHPIAKISKIVDGLAPGLALDRAIAMTTTLMGVTANALATLRAPDRARDPATAWSKFTHEATTLAESIDGVGVVIQN